MLLYGFEKFFAETKSLENVMSCEDPGLVSKEEGWGDEIRDCPVFHPNTRHSPRLLGRGSDTFSTMSSLTVPSVGHADYSAAQSMAR